MFHMALFSMLIVKPLVKQAWALQTLHNRNQLSAKNAVLFIHNSSNLMNLLHYLFGTLIAYVKSVKLFG
jgi:hypothetical protein